MKISKQNLVTAGVVFTAFLFILAVFEDLTNWQENVQLWENLKFIRVTIAPFIVFVILRFDERRKQKLNKI